MSFNEMDILLFQRFFSPKTDSKFVFDMIQINFNKNINKCNDKKVMNIKFNLEYIIKNYLQYQIKQRITLKKKHSISVDDENYSKLLDSYDIFYKDLLNKNAFNKIPYSYFLVNGNNLQNNNEIFKDKNKTEYFFHVILNYAYYLIFVQNNNNYKAQHNLIPTIFKNNKNNKDLSSLIESESKYINDEKYKKYFINYIINFFVKYNSQYPNIISALNQASLEILIHILVEYYSINNTTNMNKFLFIFKSKPDKVFRTLLLFNDKNANIPKYKTFTNDLLCLFLSKSNKNILLIIKMFNIKGMDENTSLKVFNDMYTKHKLSDNHKAIRNLFLFLMEIILNCLKIKNKILTIFMIKALDEISLSYSFDSDLNNICIFESFTSSFLQKFGIKINYNEFTFYYISSDTKKNKNNNCCRYIGKRMSDYLYLLSTNFQLITKKSFENINKCFDKGFLYLFDIINLLTCESQFYYLNIENKNLKNYRKNILIYISDLFGYLDKNKISKEIFKYYFRPNYFWLKKNIKHDIVYNIDDPPSIKIEISKKLNFLNLCNYLSSEEYQIKVLNSIQNIFSNVSPFNTLEIQCSLLENYLDEINEQNNAIEKNNIIKEKEKVIELPKDLILSEEDEEELKKYLDKISINSIKYKEKIIFIILENLSKESNNAEELTLKSNPTKILYLIIKILSTESVIDNNDILVNCIQCVYTLHKIGKLFFDYEDEIKYISLLQDIKNKKENDLQKDLEEKMTELINELLTNVKNKNENNNENKKIENETEEDKIIFGLINNCKKVEMKKDKFELTFNLKKMYNDLDTSPNTNKARKISMETIQFTINYLNHLLLNKCFDDAFMTQNVLKVYRNLFLSIKSDENLRKFYLKIIGENLYSLLNKKKYISEKEKATKIEASSKIFELFMKIIKKLKYKSFLIGKDILKILFEVFENEQKGIYQLTPYSIVSCISICAYLVEYCHEEIMLYMSIIIRTGINFLKSTKSSTIEQQRASSFLLYKVLDSLNDQELDTYSKEIFDACSIAQTYAKDDNLLFYLNKCLNYYT